jgi:hypothetical protein
MEEKNSQENAIEPIEPIEPTETKIDIPTTEVDIDILSRTNKENIEVPQETKGDFLSRTKQHRENIDEIIVPQYIHYIEDQYIENNYVVTYSFIDKSFLRWKINIEENGQQHPDLYFELDMYGYYKEIVSFKLCKKTLLFCHDGGDGDGTQQS